MTTKQTSYDRKIKAKKNWLLLKYNLSNIAKRMPGKVPIFLFCLNGLVIATLFIPPVGQWVRESPLSGKQEPRLQVQGVVRKAVLHGSGMEVIEPAAGTVIEVGGYRTVSDAAGRYELEFPSDNRRNIPVVFTNGVQEFVSRITFSPGHNIEYRDITFQ